MVWTKRTFKDATWSLTAPSSPTVGQLWIDFNSNPPIPKEWSGSAWVTASGEEALDAEFFNSFQDHVISLGGAGLAGTVNLSDYATPGVSVQNVAIQNALTAAAGKTLWVSGGTFNTGDNYVEVPANTRITGDKSGLITSGFFATLYLNSGCEVDHIKISNTRGTDNMCVYPLANAKKVKVHHNSFVTGNNLSAAMKLDVLGLENIEFSHNDVDGLLYGVYAAQTSYDLKNIRVLYNDFDNMYGDAITFDHGVQAYSLTEYGTGRNIRVLGNTIRCNNGTAVDFGMGIAFAGVTHFVCAHNHIRYARFRGINIEDRCRNFSVHSNTIDQVAAVPSGDNHGIILYDARSFSVSDNDVRNCAQSGIVLASSTSNEGDQGQVWGNRCSGNAQYGMDIRSDGQNYSGRAALAVWGNQTNNNTGSEAGLRLWGVGREVQLLSHQSHSNSGWGIWVSHARLGFDLGKLSTTGNTLGDLNLDTPLFPVTLRERTGTAQATITTNVTPATNLFELGVRANGLLTIMARNAAGTAAASQVWSITWDGTTFVATAFGTVSNTGGLTFSTPTQASGFLRVVANLTATNGTVIDMNAQFDGVLLQN